MSQDNPIPDARLLHRQLDGLSTRTDAKWAELIDLILSTSQQERLSRAVNAAAVARTFDSGLLAELVDAENLGGVGIGQVISKLIALRVLQQLTDISGRPMGRFRLHEFIRLSVADRLRTDDEDSWLRLHAAAAQHYFRLLMDADEDPYDCYGAWYRFEDAEWQEHKRDWLWHSGLAANPHRHVITRARFALVFLDAFWWWGVYLPFPFMRNLLEDWNRVSSTWERPPATGRSGQEEDDQKFLESLTALLNDYPVTHVKPPTHPWDRIRGNLSQIRLLCGLNPAGGLKPAIMRRATDEEKDEMRRVDAFITLFLAHTWRFRDPSDPEAEKYYQAAADAFETLGDEWTSAWITFERADMCLEQGDLTRAASFLAVAGAAIRDLAARTGEWDRELLANLHRAWADICWLSGRLYEAAGEYGRAIAHAYWFLGVPNLDGGTHGPDRYTQQFYVEMTSRAAERMAELSGRPGELDQFTERLRSKLPGNPPAVPTASLADAGTDLIRRTAFLPGPADSDLFLLNTPFMATWIDLSRNHDDPRASLDKLITSCGG
jgi:hypothetical protein